MSVIIDSGEPAKDFSPARRSWSFSSKDVIVDLSQGEDSRSKGISGKKYFSLNQLRPRAYIATFRDSSRNHKTRLRGENIRDSLWNS